MDATAAAAAVMTIAMDANAPQDSGRRGFCVTVGMDDVDMTDQHSVAEDKENNDVHAAGGEVEDPASKVTIAPRVLCPATYTPPLTR